MNASVMKRDIPNLTREQAQTPHNPPYSRAQIEHGGTFVCLWPPVFVFLGDETVFALNEMFTWKHAFCVGVQV